jgi:iron complex outermembrane recepter protein
LARLIPYRHQTITITGWVMRSTVIAGVVSFCLLGAVLAAPAGASISRKATSIPAESLDQALRELAKDRQFQVLYRADLVRDKRTAGAVGQFTPEEALNKLLSGTGLSYTYLDATTVTIVPVALQSAASATQPDQTPEEEHQKETGKNSSQNFLVAQADQAGTGPQALDEKKEEKSPALEEVVVTGTHIHNVAPISPIITITHDDIVRQGYTTLAEVIEQLPQNFLGGASPASNPIAGFGGSLATSNFTFESSINLRGLGPNATLVLLNGRRMAPAAFSGVADISNIPVNIIDRIEILTDGASSVYGADAVAGVVNIITKRDFSGVQVGGGLTEISSGKTPDHDANVLTGDSWAGGGFVASADYEKDNPLYARNRYFSADLPDPWELTPKNEKMNVYVSAHQDLSDALTLNGDAFVTRRNFDIEASQYASYGSSDPVTRSGRAEQYSISLQLDYKVSSDWAAALIGQVSKELDHVVVDIPTFDQEDVSNPSFYRVTSFESRVDGKLFDAPGGQIRAAFGAQYLEESFEDIENVGTPPAPPPSQTYVDSRHVSSAYGELSIPLIGKDNGVPLATGLRVDISGRYDRYSDFGSTSNPRYAIEWDPAADLKIHGSYSRSFQAPTFGELSTPFFGAVLPLPDSKSATGSTLSLLTDGGNPSLNPETAKSLNFGATYEPEGLPGLKIDISYFSVRFDNQIISPGDLVFYGNALQDEAILGPAIVQQNPSLAAVNQLLSNPRIENLTGGQYLPSDIGAIVNYDYLNSASSNMNGEDLQVVYKIQETPIGRFSVDADASYFNKYTYKITDVAPTSSFLNTVLNPLRLRAKVNFGWSQGPWGANGRVNYSNAYKNTLDTDCAATDSCDVSSWTTVDFEAFYAPRTGTVPRWLEDTRVALVVTNAFNRAPPSVSLPSTLYPNYGYDALNASPLLRTFGVTFTKRFGGNQD